MSDSSSLDSSDVGSLDSSSNVGSLDSSSEASSLDSSSSVSSYAEEYEKDPDWMPEPSLKRTFSDSNTESDSDVDAPQPKKMKFDSDQEIQKLIKLARESINYSESDENSELKGDSDSDSDSESEQPRIKKRRNMTSNRSDSSSNSSSSETGRNFLPPKPAAVSKCVCCKDEFMQPSTSTSNKKKEGSKVDEGNNSVLVPLVSLFSTFISTALVLLYFGTESTILNDDILKFYYDFFKFD